MLRINEQCSLNSTTEQTNLNCSIDEADHMDTDHPQTVMLGRSFYRHSPDATIFSDLRKDRDPLREIQRANAKLILIKTLMYLPLSNAVN